VFGVIKFQTDLRKIGSEGVVWVHLAQIRDRWQDLANMVMTLLIP
jgi:hypothetical protein